MLKLAFMAGLQKALAENPQLAQALLTGGAGAGAGMLMADDPLKGALAGGGIGALGGHALGAAGVKLLPQKPPPLKVPRWPMQLGVLGSTPMLLSDDKGESIGTQYMSGLHNIGVASKELAAYLIRLQRDIGIDVARRAVRQEVEAQGYIPKGWARSLPWFT